MLDYSTIDITDTNQITLGGRQTSIEKMRKSIAGGRDMFSQNSKNLVDMDKIDSVVEHNILQICDSKL